METLVKIKEGLYLNVAEALKMVIEGDGTIRIFMKEGSKLGIYTCHRNEPGYPKLKKLLAAKMSPKPIKDEAKRRRR